MEMTRGLFYLFILATYPQVSKYSLDPYYVSNMV